MTQANIESNKFQMISEAAELKTIHLIVNNSPGVLVRIALAFTRRSINIESLVVNSIGEGKSQLTISTSSDDKRFALIVKQLTKLVDVLKVETPNDEKDHIQREMVVVRIRTADADQKELNEILGQFKTETVEKDDDHMVVQITGYRKNLDHCLNQLKAFDIIDCVRSGNVVMPRF